MCISILQFCFLLKINKALISHEPWSVFFLSMLKSLGKLTFPGGLGGGGEGGGGTASGSRNPRLSLHGKFLNKFSLFF